MPEVPMMKRVRTVLRYLLISCVVVGLAWAGFAVKIGDRSLFGHLRAMGGGADVGDAWTRLRSDLEARLAELRREGDERKKSKPTPAPAKVSKPAPPKTALSREERKANERQVSKLRDAASLAEKKAAAAKKTPPPPVRTRIDERPPDRAALDRILTAPR
jgi:hypothetical protein